VLSAIDRGKLLIHAAGQWRKHVNGDAPIADLFGPLAPEWPGLAHIDISSFMSANASGLNLKVQLLELCARIGYTPHA
jgi:hypothetical protein